MIENLNPTPGNRSAELGKATPKNQSQVAQPVGPIAQVPRASLPQNSVPVASVPVGTTPQESAAPSGVIEGGTPGIYGMFIPMRVFTALASWQGTSGRELADGEAAPLPSTNQPVQADLSKFQRKSSARGDNPDMPAVDSLPDNTKAPKTPAELEKLAESVRKIKDKDRRLQVLVTETLPQLDNEDKALLLSEIYAHDSGADKWLNSDKLDKLSQSRDGKPWIGTSSRQALNDAASKAYAQGYITRDQLAQITTVDESVKPPLTTEALFDLAEDIHRTGARKGKKDDYDARLARLADELSTINETERARLIGQILEDDPDAPNSWLQKDRLDKLVNQDKISADDRSLVTEAVKDGYSGRFIDKKDAEKIADLGDAPAPRGETTESSATEIPQQVSDGDYRVADANTFVREDEIKNVSFIDDTEWISVEMNDGTKIAVEQSTNPSLYNTLADRYVTSDYSSIDNAREKAGVASRADTEVLNMTTDVADDDGAKMSVGAAAMSKLMEDLSKRSDLDPDSPLGQLQTALLAQSRLQQGGTIVPYYEDKSSGVGSHSSTKTGDMTRLEPSDWRDIYDSEAVTAAFDRVMADPSSAELYGKYIQEAADKIPAEPKKQMADKLYDLITSPDYIAEINKLSDAEMPRAISDINDAISNLTLLDPTRAAEATGIFTQQAFAAEIDRNYVDQASVTPEVSDKSTRTSIAMVTKYLGGRSPMVEKALTDLLNGPADDRTALAKIAQLDSDGKRNQAAVDAIFDGLGTNSAARATIQGLADEIEKAGLSAAFISSIGLANAVITLMGPDGFGEDPLKDAGTIGSVISFAGALPDSTRLLRRTFEGAGTAVLEMFGVNVTSGGSPVGSVTREIGKAVADTQSVDISDIPNSTTILDGINDRASNANSLIASSEEQRKRFIKGFAKHGFTLTARVGGILAVVGGGGAIASAFKNNATPAEKASAILTTMSGANGVINGISSDLSKILMPDSTKNYFSTVLQGLQKSAGGQLARRIFAAVRRGTGVLGVALDLAAVITQVFVTAQKNNKARAKQYKTFTDAEKLGILQDDWRPKVDWVLNTLNNFDDAHIDPLKNMRDLKGMKWGGRQAPGDMSMFDYHREEFAEFRKKWENNPTPTSQVEYLDTDARKRDQKRNKEETDEAKRYMENHPTYYQGADRDWVLKPNAEDSPDNPKSPNYTGNKN